MQKRSTNYTVLCHCVFISVCIHIYSTSATYGNLLWACSLLSPLPSEHKKLMEMQSYSLPFSLDLSFGYVMCGRISHPDVFMEAYHSSSAAPLFFMVYLLINLYYFTNVVSSDYSHEIKRWEFVVRRNMQRGSKATCPDVTCSLSSTVACGSVRKVQTNWEGQIQAIVHPSKVPDTRKIWYMVVHVTTYSTWVCVCVCALAVRWL